jgi:selenocysteine lyase/cysteine desulfurase
LGFDGRVRHEAEWNRLRQLAGAALGLSADEIGICSCSSEAFNLAAMALRLRDQDEVVINDLDFPSGVTPWLQPGRPAMVRLWRSSNGALRTEYLIPLLGPRTRLVTLSLVSFYNGYRAQLAEIIAAVRRHSPALVSVDVTQALGRIVLDLSGVDLIISSTHKWVLGVHGGGIVGVPQRRANEWTVPAGGWFNIQSAFSKDRFERALSKPGAASFCVGMPNYAAVYANAAALEYIQATTVKEIETHANSLVRACLDELKHLPVELLTPDEGESLAGIIAIRHPRAQTIHSILHEHQIHVMHHAGRLRVAWHGYNTSADVDRFLSVMHVALRRA